MTRQQKLTAIALIGLCQHFAFAGDDHTPIGDAVEELPIFDTHMHYKEPAWGPYPVEDVIELMDKSGVAMALVSSTPDEGTIMLWEYAPNRIVPELRPYHGSYGSHNWTGYDGMERYLKDRLEKYPHQGIGEFHIRSVSMWNEPLFQRIIEMAKKLDIYLHVHSDAEPIRWLYGLDADVKIIWAHAGLGVHADNVYELMAEFPNLLADTSLREQSILAGVGKLHPTWKKIIFEFHQRLMVGSDTWVNGQWDHYEWIIASNRAWLRLLPREMAENIAYKNAERYFERDITTEHIGTRQ